MKNRFDPERILITGASGGLGSALARHYARPGVHLSLWGRDVARLSAVAAACRAAGATAEWRSLDLADLEAAVAALAAEDAAAPIDLAIIAAGQGDIRAPGDRVEHPELVARLGTINFTAPVTIAAAAATHMAARNAGRIVLIGSAAGFHSLPFSAAYSGTKAGLARFADALRLGVRDHGVSVTLVSPGFIDTVARRKIPGPKPMLIQPEAAAARIARAAAAGKAHLILPWPFALLRLFDRLLPRALRDWLLSSLIPPDR